MRVKVDLTGDKELIKTFDALIKGAQEECVEKALQEAAEVIRADAVTRVPKQTGALARSIKATPVKITRNGGAIHVAAGVKTGSEDAFYAHMVEKGHDIAVPTGQKRSGYKRQRRADLKIVGRVAPRPYLRPALDENEAEVQRVFTQALIRVIKEVKL